MSEDYIDQSDGGWLTRDYTMDASDLARMNVTGGVRQRNGSVIPTVNGDNFMPPQRMDGLTTDSYGRPLGPDMPPAPGSMGYAGTTAPRGNAGYTVPGVTGNAAAGQTGNGAGRVTSQPVAPQETLPGVSNTTINAPPAIVPTPGIRGASTMLDPQTALAQSQEQLDSAIDYSRTPLVTGGSPGQLGQSRSQRASFVPGGRALFDTMVKGGYDPNQQTPAADLPPLLDPDGKALPSNNIDQRIVSHPAFRQMEANDKLMGTNNAAAFYNSQTGGDLDADRKGYTALQAAASTNRLALAKTLSEKTVTATKADPDKGIQPGDTVTRTIVPSITGGDSTVVYLPLTQQEKGLLNITPDTTTDANGVVTQKLDQYNRPSESPKGRSYVEQATGIKSAADLNYAQGLLNRRNADRESAASTASQGPSSLTVPSNALAGPTVSGRGHDPAVAAAIVRGGTGVPFDQQPTAGQEAGGIYSGALTGDTALDNITSGVGRALYNTGQSFKGGLNNISGLFGGSGNVVSPPDYQSAPVYARARAQGVQDDSMAVAAKAHSDYLIYKKTGAWPTEPDPYQMAPSRDM